MKFAVYSFILVLSFIGETSHATGALVSLGSELVFEQASNGRSYEIRQPWSLRAGYRFPIADALVEYSSFNTADGTDMSTVGRTHHEWTVWGRRALWQNQQARFNPYAALGTGLQYDVVSTTFTSETDKNAGRTESFAALAVGVAFDVWENLEITAEGKALASASAAPNPTLSAAAHLGWKF